MNPASKKLVIWLLGAAIGLCMHASYVSGKRGPVRSSHAKPLDILTVHALLSEEEFTGLRALYENFMDATDDGARYLAEAPSELERVADSSPTPVKTKDKLFNPIIIEVAGRHEMDPALIKAIIMAESGHNPKAVSKRGAKGLMQLMPITAKSLGVKDVFNPEHNIKAGVFYFKKLLNQFNGDVKLALAAYNAGSRKVKKYKGIPPFKATRIYIRKVFKYYELYKEQM
ncbi:MAG: lytic transglycosylase domain-containing protein [Desulfobacteraceae bacterium]|jgi:soluble lytic murein transglycosylase-like protein